MYKTVELVKEGRLARLTLNRPASMNAMDPLMMEELGDVLESLKTDKTVQVLLIKGAGRAFSAGGDIKGMLANKETGSVSNNSLSDISRLTKALYTLPQITIAVIHGAAAGLGFSLALGCDTIIAEDESKLAMNFIGIGLVPDGAGHFFMKERVGTPQAKQLIWAGKVMNGPEALEKGLIEEVVAAGEAAARGEALAAQYLASPINAMIASKNILHTQKIAELDNVLKMESEAQAAMSSTEDHLEGIQAFVEKRTPAFVGK